MLLDQNPRTETINDEDSTNLIRLLFASVRKAVGEKIIPSVDNRKQYHSKAQRVRFFFFFLQSSCFLKESSLHPMNSVFRINPNSLFILLKLGRIK